MKFDETQRESLDRWLRMGAWSKREALMLFCGADPEKPDIPHMHALPCFDDFEAADAHEEYQKLSDLWRRGQHNHDSYPPTFFIDWAVSQGIKIPWLSTQTLTPVQNPGINGSSQTESSHGDISSQEKPTLPDTETVQLALRGDTARRLHRAIKAFEDRYPDYKDRTPKLDADVRPWLREAGLIVSPQEAVVFGQILRQHFDI